jgi:hypothetical protein
MPTKRSKVSKKQEVARRPFSSAGCRNNNKLFSSFPADASVKKGSRPASSPSGAFKPLCDRNGAPIGTHAGMTSLRARSEEGGWVGCGVPYGARKMDYTKEREWIPNPKEEERPVSYRSTDPSKRLTTSFKLGSGKPGLFDKNVRVMSSNHTNAPDKKLLEWVQPQWYDHPKPFAVGSYPLEKAHDRRFLARNGQFPDSGQPYEDYELQSKQTMHPFIRGGFRPDTQPRRTHPFRPTNMHNPLPGTDRNPRLWGARNETGMDFHDGEGARNPRFRR